MNFFLILISIALTLFPLTVGISLAENSDHDFSDLMDLGQPQKVAQILTII
jgi:hypothetical protein